MTNTQRSANANKYKLYYTSTYSEVLQNVLYSAVQEVKRIQDNNFKSLENAYNIKSEEIENDTVSKNAFY